MFDLDIIIYLLIEQKCFQYSFYGCTEIEIQRAKMNSAQVRCILNQVFHHDCMLITGIQKRCMSFKGFLTEVMCVLLICCFVLSIWIRLSSCWCYLFRFWKAITIYTFERYLIIAGIFWLFFRFWPFEQQIVVVW